jgi:hypothetical protein
MEKHGSLAATTPTKRNAMQTLFKLVAISLIGSGLTACGASSDDADADEIRTSTPAEVALDGAEGDRTAAPAMQAAVERAELGSGPIGTLGQALTTGTSVSSTAASTFDSGGGKAVTSSAPPGSGVLQQAPTKPGGKGYTCDKAECSCTGEGNCNKMFSSNDCDTGLLNSVCSNVDGVETCFCTRH